MYVTSPNHIGLSFKQGVDITKSKRGVISCEKPFCSTYGPPLYGVVLPYKGPYVHTRAPHPVPWRGVGQPNEHDTSTNTSRQNQLHTTMTLDNND